MSANGKNGAAIPRSEVSLVSNTAGIVSPNPFWLASAPPANSGDQIKRAFDCGWGGVEPSTVVDLSEGEPRVIREGAGDPAPFLS